MSPSLPSTKLGPGYQWDMCIIVLSLPAQHCMAIYLPTSCAHTAVSHCCLGHCPVPSTPTQSSLFTSHWSNMSVRGIHWHGESGLLPCPSKIPWHWTVFFSLSVLTDMGQVDYCHVSPRSPETGLSPSPWSNMSLRRCHWQGEMWGIVMLLWVLYIWSVSYVCLTPKRSYYILCPRSTCISEGN